MPASQDAACVDLRQRSSLRGHLELGLELGEDRKARAHGEWPLLRGGNQQLRDRRFRVA